MGIFGGFAVNKMTSLSSC